MPYTDHIGAADVDPLLEEQEGPCVSIHLPTSVVTRDTEQDRIVLKNLRAEAFERLSALGLRRPDAEAVLLPVDDILEDESFWPYLSDGLALYCARGMHAVYRLPVRFEPEVRVGDRFHLRPLIPLLTEDGLFFIVAVSENRLRLLEGTRHHVQPLDVAGLPADMTEALRRRGRDPIRKPSRRWQGDEGQKLRYRLYFQQIDRTLRHEYRGHADPLVFAGVDYLFPIFRDAVSYRGLLDQPIMGNPDQMTAQELHAQAWPIVEPVLARPRRAALASYGELHGTGRTSTDLETILGAALDGRIQALFVRQSATVFGTFDQARRTVELHEERASQDLDLIARAARWAYGTGALIFAGEPPEIPEATPLAAVFRSAVR
jgi:Bacterial archaeo-eukaryotic release factor family 3